MKSVTLFSALVVMVATACFAQDTDAVVVHVGNHVIGESVQQFANLEGVRVPKVECTGHAHEQVCRQSYRTNTRDGYTTFAFEAGYLAQVTYVAYNQTGEYALHHRLIDEYGKPNKIELIPWRNALGIQIDAVHAIWLGGRVEETQIARDIIGYPDTVVTIR